LTPAPLSLRRRATRRKEKIGRKEEKKEKKDLFINALLC
jgi:hypothetical protein